MVGGRGDSMVSADYYQTFTAALPSAELVHVPAAGHYPEIEQPAMTTELAVQFVAKNDSDRLHTMAGRDGRQRKPGTSASARTRTRPTPARLDPAALSS